MVLAILATALSTILLIATPIHAQDLDYRTPAIMVAATGQVDVEADHAVLTLGVNVQDSTPTAAAAAMDVRLIALTDTLVALGYPRDSLPTASYQVTPVRDYRAGQQIVGYSADASVTVTIWDIVRLPFVIEAALSAGATDVGDLRFGTSDERDARDEALRRAIAEARHDAEIIAGAAGGRLGTMIEIATSQPAVRQARAVELSSVSGPTPQLTPRKITVTANVTARWAFLEN